MSESLISQPVADLLNGTFSYVVATVRPDGQPATAVVWVDWDGQHVRFSSKVGSRKARNIRANPWVSINAHDAASKSWAAVRGEVVDIRPDKDLAFIDHLSERHKGVPYGVREFEREIYSVEVRNVRSSFA